MNINFNPRIYLPQATNIRPDKSLNFIKDSISFSGNTAPKSENETEAEEFGLNLYALMQNGNLTLRTIEEQGRRNIPILKVDKISNLKKLIGSFAGIYTAYTLPEYNSNCRLKKLTLFAPDEIKEPKNIGSVAHEYTHCLQRYKSGSYLGLEKYTNGDLLQTRALNSISAAVFSNLETALRNSEIIARADISDTDNAKNKEAVYRAYGCKNGDEYRRLNKRAFNEFYDFELAKVMHSREIRAHLPLINSPLQLKRIIREQCRLRADLEKEAYQVQKNVIRKIDPSLVTNENKFNPIFYGLLSDSLS